MSGEPHTTFKTRDQVLGELKKAVGEADARVILQGERKVVTSCGSGMTAGVSWLGLYLLDVRDVALYHQVRSFPPVSVRSVIEQMDCLPELARVCDETLE